MGNARYTKSAALFQVPFLVIIGYWSWRLPAPGIAVSILGLAAVVMAIRASRFTRMEEIVWIVVAIALCFAEIQAIRKDRLETNQAQERAHREENEKFASLLEEGRKHFEATVTQSQSQFAATMDRSSGILGGISDSIKATTGGDSFAYITFTPEPNQQFLVAITSHGKYPLREVHATMIDDERRVQAMQEFNKHPEGSFIAAIQAGDTYFRVPYLRPQSPEGPSGDVEMLGSYPFGSKDANDITIAFSSLNGYWNERLHLRRINGKWHQALSVMGPTVKQSLHPFIYFDPDYPEGKALAEKDWPRVKPKSRR